MRGTWVSGAWALLVLVSSLAPAAGADWEVAHRFPASADRSIIDFAFDEGGVLHLLSWHRGAFLVYDTNATGNWTATFIRERDGIGSVALGRIDGKYGALYSVPVPFGQAPPKDAGFTWFGTAGKNETAVLRKAGPEAPWNVWRTMPDGVMTLRVDGIRWNFTLFGTDEHPLRWVTYPRVDRPLAGLSILDDGTAFGATWNRTGAYALHVTNASITNLTLLDKIAAGHRRDPRVNTTLLDRFWDFRAASAAIAPNGTAFAWYTRGSKACDTFWGDPRGPFRRVPIDPCPLDEEAPGAFVFEGPRPLAILNNRIMVVGEQPTPLECVPSFRTPRTDHAGRTFLIGGGGGIFRERGSPTLNFTQWPTSGFTGFAVRFLVSLEDSEHRPDLALRWDFGDTFPGSTGWDVNRTYYKPGNYTVRAVAKWDGCGATPIEVARTLTIDGPAMDAPKSTPTAPLITEPDFGEDLQDSAASRLPAPGLLAAVGIVGLAAAATRRRRS